MILPAMQRVHDKVDFKLSFIGKYACPKTHLPLAGKLQPTDTRTNQADRQRRRRMQARPGRMSGQHHRALRTKALPRPKDLPRLHHVPDAGLQGDSAEEPNRGLRPRARYQL